MSDRIRFRKLSGDCFVRHSRTRRPASPTPRPGRAGVSELGDPAVIAARTDANAAAIRERALPDERGGLVAIFAFDDNFGDIFKPKSAVFDFDETEPDSRAGTWSCG